MYCSPDSRNTASKASERISIRTSTDSDKDCSSCRYVRCLWYPYKRVNLFTTHTQHIHGFYSKIRYYQPSLEYTFLGIWIRYWTTKRRSSWSERNESNTVISIATRHPQKNKRNHHNAALHDGFPFGHLFHCGWYMALRCNSVFLNGILFLTTAIPKFITYHS